MKKKILAGIVFGCLLVSFLTGCGKKDNALEAQEQEIVQEQKEAETVPEEKKSETEEVGEVVTEPEFEEYDITLMAVGDNLMHMGVISTGDMGDGSYDYSFLFEGISEFLETADIKIINQETILGGNDFGFSGYPAFNSPTEVGDAIAEAGFNVVLHASNHSADKGITGLLNCVSYWKTKPEVLVTGIYEQATKSHDIPILTIEDIDFAILNYTYGPNLETMPKSIRGHLDMLCDWDEESGKIDFTKLHPQVIEDIQRAEEMADVVIVCPHWGTEYMTSPSSYQEEFALQMVQAGADLIVGTHPHVVQPVDWVESENGNKALCYYSLGNYVSTQKGALSMLEAMAWVTFTVKEDGIEISEEQTGILPMVCHYNSGPVRVESIYLLEEYTEEQAKSHGILEYGGVQLKLEELQTWSDEILGEWMIPSKQALGGNRE